jgi:hypothetical protein
MFPINQAVPKYQIEEGKSMKTRYPVRAAIVLLVLAAGTLLFDGCPQPDSPTTENPGGGGENPGEGGENPGEGGENPGGGGENPGESGENPGGGGENPGEGGENPGEGGENPDEGGENPDEGGENPGGNETFGGNFAYGANNVVVSVNPAANSAAVSIAGYVPVPRTYKDPSSFIVYPGVEFSIPVDIRSDLAGLSVSIAIENDNSDAAHPSPGTLSLSVVHEIYQAVKAAGAAGVSVKSDTLVPLYRGSDWLKEGYFISDPYVNFYKSYADGEVLMPGLTIRKFGGLYALEYARNLVVVDVVYRERPGSDVYGAGLYKKSGTSASLVPSTGNWADVVIAGDEGVGYSGITSNPSEYLSRLAAAGLLYTGGNTPSPTHKMSIGSYPGLIAQDKNMFSNGLYGFLKEHVDGGKIDRLSDAGFPSGSYLDGSFFEGQGQQRRLSDGHYNTAFAGNIPVYMVNALRSRIEDFSNVNIIGSGSDLDSTVDLNLANVSLVGDYSSVDIIGHFYGLIDIEGYAPMTTENRTGSPSAYLTVWDVAGNTSMNNFVVFHVKPKAIAKVQQIGANNGGYINLAPLQALVFESRGAITKIGTASVYTFDSIVPTAYRAVRDPATGICKFVGGTAEGFPNVYASDTSRPVPTLDPALWRAAGNSKSYSPAASSWPSLDPSKKWTPGDLNAISMIRGAGIRLADAVLPRFGGRSMG